ncbi:hypothetical protein KK083_12195 [Fulvivirgaceae bacterium PWU4]|uniref:Uncharacterized protein n=1 Tax=Chryseosolibacter histidini TaxID=2782349 RepID=A0AAP2GN47_9BACT|nr:hypothetical protein [Chryseosolibacter histidini]MBT1697643.1 hypothetical protein [Chryseosolibacter histidini]
MYRKILTLLVLIGLISCQQDELITVDRAPADIEVQDGMLVFASEQVYSKTLLAIERMSPVEQKAWTNQFRFTPLSNLLSDVTNPDKLIETQGLSHLTPAHWLVLNNERRVRIGEVVMYFNDKTKYFMDVNEYNKLTDKRDIARSPWTGIILSEVLNNTEGSNERIYFDAWNNGNIGVGGTQHTFDSPAGKRKFVIEWVSSVEQTSLPANGCGDIHMHARLYLRCKNLRQGGSSWVNAFEPYSVAVNIDVDGVRFYYGLHQPSNECNYEDAMWGPPGVPYNGYFAHISASTVGYISAGDFYVLIAGPPDFYGEKRATFDLKKWEGYSTGTVTMHNAAAPYAFTYIM